MPEKELIQNVRAVTRAYALEDLHVRSDGSGRIVEAYAAVFGSQAEVMDQDGHYNEKIGSGAFARTLNKGAFRNPVLFNHGRTIDGAPNPAATMPVGVPIEVKTDERGLWTATRYLDNPLADQVLDSIKQGAITAQSFSGRFHKSYRSYPQGRSGSSLPLIERSEIALREYGPAVFAAYGDAAILGTRQLTTFMRSLLALGEDDRLDFLRQFEGLSSPLDTANPIIDSPEVPDTSQTTDTGTTVAPSERSVQMRTKLEAFRTRHGLSKE